MLVVCLLLKKFLLMEFIEEFLGQIHVYLTLEGEDGGHGVGFRV